VVPQFVQERRLLIDEFTFVKRGRTLVFVDASFGESVDPRLAPHPSGRGVDPVRLATLAATENPA
jgi:hypothetical protein